MPRRPRIVLVLAVVFLFGPLAMLALGSRPSSFENRSPAPRPSLAQGWDVFDDATRYLTEHLPLRERAVRANTRLSQDVFAYTPAYGAGAGADEALPFAGAPAPKAAAAAKRPGATGAPAGDPPGLSAVPGKGGWLFLQQDFDYACAPPVDAATAVARWQRLARAVEASGRTINIIVGPDKSEAYADQLPDSNAKLACRAEKSAELWDAIGAAGPAFTPNLRDVIAAERKARGAVPVYYRKDTHWNELGALAATKAVVEALSKTVRVRPGDTRPAGDLPYPGDLNRMSGAPDEDTAPGLLLTRPGAGKRGLTPKRIAGVDAQVDRPVGATAPMVQGRVLLVHDSFAWGMQPQLAQYLADLTSVSFLTSPEALAKLIARSDHVVVETGQREFINRSGLYAGVTADAIGPARE